ncbi:nucleotidyltransferase [Mucilaginibacter sp. ZT4R22]|uniref:Nucleotidyltransferase n=1 Tax=Mucilaginibacter pankratovii TaxID=2772110 RepID=A0ABR7WYS3_9SPHI|nr:nucleotidyltransferase [Mucilaginibacter pankratovii]MBD1367438.1 nucleotidyltransferase [Mucilaginibacter pankratovii]
MILEKDFQDFIDLLNKHEVAYLIVGAHALAFHGKPRHTGDLDIWINPTDENAAKMILVINDFGFGSVGLTKGDFLREHYVTQLGYPPLRIDILNSISGVSFDEAYENKLFIDIDELTISYIGLDDLIKNKAGTARKQDIADLENLYKLADASKSGGDKKN